jgi:hypothetical protein
MKKPVFVDDIPLTFIFKKASPTGFEPVRVSPADF